MANIQTDARSTTKHSAGAFDTERGRDVTIVATMNLSHFQVCHKRETSVRIGSEMKDARPRRQDVGYD